MDTAVDEVHFLDDDGPPHQFLSHKSRLSFHRALKRASVESTRAGKAAVSWLEEWNLLRHEDAAGGGVSVTAVVTDFLESAARESVTKSISAARKKFEAKQWAAHLAVALHADEQQREVPLSFYADAITDLKAADLQPLQSVFLVGATACSRLQVNLENFHTRITSKGAWDLLPSSIIS